MIENKLDRETPEVPPVGARWHYMDIWDMALQRPDAHTQNLVDPAHENYDCLHCTLPSSSFLACNKTKYVGCVPGVVEQWLQLLYHTVTWDKDGNQKTR